MNPSRAGANGSNGNAANRRKPEITVAGPQPSTLPLPGVGERAPSFSLLGLDGSVVRNEELLGHDTLLLFWNPSCPFCREMADDIARWEANPPRRAPRLVFVSSGSAEAVRAESIRFTSRFLHDPELSVGALFGTGATPSAVLVDADGMIASAVESGRVNVLALAGARKLAVQAASSV